MLLYVKEKQMLFLLDVHFYVIQDGHLKLHIN